MKMYVYGVLLVFYFVINKRNLLFTFEHRRSAHSDLGGSLPLSFLYESLNSLILIDEILLLYNFLSSLSPKFYFTRFGPLSFIFHATPMTVHVNAYTYCTNY